MSFKVFFEILALFPMKLKALLELFRLVRFPFIAFLFSNRCSLDFIVESLYIEYCI